jgi:hypothetical protein
VYETELCKNQLDNNVHLADPIEEWIQVASDTGYQTIRIGGETTQWPIEYVPIETNGDQGPVFVMYPFCPN